MTEFHSITPVSPDQQWVIDGQENYTNYRNDHSTPVTKNGRLFSALINHLAMSTLDKADDSTYLESREKNKKNKV